MYNNQSVVELIHRAHRINANPNERGTLSRGQIAEIGLLLDRHDWLAEAGFSMAEAVARLSHAELDAVVFASRNLYSDAAY